MKLISSWLSSSISACNHMDKPFIPSTGNFCFPPVCSHCLCFSFHSVIPIPVLLKQNVTSSSHFISWGFYFTSCLSPVKFQEITTGTVSVSDRKATWIIVDSDTRSTVLIGMWNCVNLLLWNFYMPSLWIFKMHVWMTALLCTALSDV